MRTYPSTHPEFWIKAACGAFCIPQDELLSSSRTRELVQFRHAAMWVARNMTNASLPFLATVFNRSDHTTIIHGVRRAEEDEYIIPLIEEIFEYVEAEDEGR